MNVLKQIKRWWNRKQVKEDDTDDTDDYLTNIKTKLAKIEEGLTKMERDLPLSDKPVHLDGFESYDENLASMMRSDEYYKANYPMMRLDSGKIMEIVDREGNVVEEVLIGESSSDGWVTTVKTDGNGQVVSKVDVLVPVKTNAELVDQQMAEMGITLVEADKAEAQELKQEQQTMPKQLLQYEEEELKEFEEVFAEELSALHVWKAGKKSKQLPKPVKPVKLTGERKIEL
jgi:hypothetical protein